MTKKKLYVDIHVIQTVPPSCINRDDTGSPKTAVYGGVRRARVSSQSWKRAMRLMFNEHFDSMKLGQRTKDIIGLVSEQMPDGHEINGVRLEDAIREVINLASADEKKPIIPDVTYEGIKKALKKMTKEENDADAETELVNELKTAIATLIQDIDTVRKVDALFKSIDNRLNSISDKKDHVGRKEFELDILEALLKAPCVLDSAGATSDALFFIGRREATNIAELVTKYCSDKSQITKKQVQEALNYYPDKDSVPCHAVDVALFGRMVAKSPVLNADASAQVAHAISTHKVENEFDYYTAVDDRAPEDNAGAGMIGTVEFSSSTLYRYSTVAVHDLFGQLAKDSQSTAEVIKEFAKVFVISMPTGKQNTFANRTLPNSVMITIRADQPVNLVGAFESPIVIPLSHANGYAEASSKKLAEYAKKTYETFAPKPVKSWQIGYGLEEIGERQDLHTALDELEKTIREELVNI